MGTARHWSRFVLPPIRFESAAPASPTPSRSIRSPAKVGPGAEPYPPDACWAKPDLGPGADAMRHLYDRADIVRELGPRARASVPGTHDATAAAASFGERGAASTGAGADR
jgi:hypothetical protein